MVPYWAAQLVGAFVGAALVYLVYHQAISSFEAANNITRGTLGGGCPLHPDIQHLRDLPRSLLRIQHDRPLHR